MLRYTEILNELRPETVGCVYWAHAQYFYNAGVNPRFAAEYHSAELGNNLVQ